MAMNRLKELRLKHHLRQYEFKKLGFSQTTYRKSEQGVRNISWDEWRKLADFYEVSIPYLQGRTIDTLLDVSTVNLNSMFTAKKSLTITNFVLNVVIKL